MENQKCRFCGSDKFNFKLIIDKKSGKLKKEESQLTCEKCGALTTVIGGKIIQ